MRQKSSWNNDFQFWLRDLFIYGEGVDFENRSVMVALNVSLLCYVYQVV